MLHCWIGRCIKLREYIIEELKQLESAFSIKILFACEAGSRAWGLASENCDYDVRFIYIHQPNDYLSIDPVGIGKKKDTIDQPIHEKFDLHGWELTKALRLYRKSNPTFLEWIHSDIMYYSFTSTIDLIKEMESKVFDAKPCLFHYVNMAKNNFRQIAEGNVKNYLNVVRPLLICRWIYENHQFPPLNFKMLVEKTTTGVIRNIFMQIYRMKITGIIEKIDDTALHSFIEKEILCIEKIAKTLPQKKKNYSSELDQLFRFALETSWNN